MGEGGMDVMSSLKAAWHVDRIQRLREGHDIVPTHVQLIISDLCNQDCHFCSYRMEGGFSTEKFADEQGNKNPNRRIPFDKALEIVDDCAALGVTAMQFTGGGEPTVHPRWGDIIARAQTHGMETALVTNGVRLDTAPPGVLERLTWLRISLDAGTAETYERIRRSKAWPQVMKNIEMAAGIKGPLLGIGFVVTRENWHELPDAARLVKRLGVPYMRVSAMFSTFGATYYDGLTTGIAAAREAAKMLEDDSFKVIDLFDDRIGDLQQAAPDYKFCGYQQFTLYIGGDQKVYTCCTNAYTTHGEIGDLRDQSFREWLGKHRRYDFDARSCHHCQFNDRNRIINYLLEPAPAHVNFV